MARLQPATHRQAHRSVTGRSIASRLINPRNSTVADMESDTYDVVVVGGGAAGLSAALVLGRARRRVAVVDAGTPRNGPAAHMQGFLSRDGMPPSDLLAAGRAEVRNYGVELIEDAVVEITTGFTLRLGSDRSITARRLLVATGAVDELPDIPGARERWGRDFLHCPYCHGCGGTRSTDRRTWNRPRSVSTRSFYGSGPTTSSSSRTPTRPPGMTGGADARNIRVIDGLVARRSTVDDRLCGGRAHRWARRSAHGRLHRPALHARRDGLLTALGCQVDAGGFALVDATGQSSVPGLWVAGNASNPRAQVITAAGEGSAAAIAINADLVEEDVSNALQNTTSQTRRRARPSTRAALRPAAPPPTTATS